MTPLTYSAMGQLIDWHRQNLDKLQLQSLNKASDSIIRSTSMSKLVFRSVKKFVFSTVKCQVKSTNHGVTPIEPMQWMLKCWDELYLRNKFDAPLKNRVLVYVSASPALNAKQQMFTRVCLWLWTQYIADLHCSEWEGLPAPSCCFCSFSPPSSWRTSTGACPSPCWALGVKAWELQ